MVVEEKAEGGGVDGAGGIDDESNVKVEHRDLKPEYFLFANKKETTLLKAIEFGLPVFFKPGERFNEIVGSPYYMAPECMCSGYAKVLRFQTNRCGTPDNLGALRHGIWMQRK